MAKSRVGAALILLIGLIFLYFTTLQLPRDYAPTSIKSRDIDEDAQNYTLLKRAPERTYADYVAYGRKLMRMLEAGPSEVEQSKWTKYTELEEYGWDVERKQNIDYEETGCVFWQNSMKRYHLSTNAKDNLLTQLYNNKPVKVGGKVFPASGGGYKNIFNSRMIIAEDNDSPSVEGPKKIPPVPKNAVTPLNRWWDVVFLQWQEFCNNEEVRMRDLDGVVRNQIRGPEALKTINQAMISKYKTEEYQMPEDYDHAVHFDMTEEGGLALLGCPNGQGVAMFLAEHKEQLGMKTITGVKLYRPSDFFPFAMMFEFGSPASVAASQKENVVPGSARDAA